MSKFIYVLLFCILGLLGINYYKQIQFEKQQRQIESSIIQQRDIGDGITRSLSRYATSDDVNRAIELNKVNLQKIEDDIKKIGTYIGAISLVSVSSMGQNSSNLPSTRSTPLSPTPSTQDSGQLIACPMPLGGSSCIEDKYGYYSTIQSLDIGEIFKSETIPFGSVSFTASKDKPWQLITFPRQYKLATISSFDEDQRMVNYNTFTIKIGDKEYSIPIESAEVIQKYPESKFRWFSPRLFLGLDAGAQLNDSSFYFGPSVSLGVMNYGKFSKEPDLSILQIGASVNGNAKDIYLNVSPISYNIGNQLPIIENTYIGPSFSFSPSTKESALLLGLRVGL